MFLMARFKGTGKEPKPMVSEFGNRQNVRNYARDVFAGKKPFNVWRVVSEAHPVSGERVRMRRGWFINGAEILSITEVKPKQGHETNHEYNPDLFEQVVLPEQFDWRGSGYSRSGSGKQGYWTAPTENTPTGAEPGVVYPIHRDEDGRRYVVLSVDPVESRLNLDGGEPGTSVVAAGTGDESDEDDDPWAASDEDDDRD
jgi:hypothetical protein